LNRSFDPRLLSHRLRGFDDAEASCVGMKRALQAGVWHVEFDVRPTSDGTIVACHDPFVYGADGRLVFVDSLPLEAVRNCQNGMNLATLDALCDTFARHADSKARLHVDVKAGGIEVAVLEILQQHNILCRSVIVSWLPAVLLAVHNLAPSVPLCFSHLTFTRFPWLFSIAQAMARGGLLSGVQKLATGLSIARAQELASVRLYFDKSGEANASPIEPIQRFAHGYAIPGMVGGALLAAIRASNGYVCVPTFMADAKLALAYEAQGIGLAVFSASSVDGAMQAIEKINPALVYCDAFGEEAAA
jgi:glycerophosphoryl diester phosphodiesterase